MLQNLVGYWGGNPTTALVHAGEQLKEAGEAAGQATAQDIANYNNQLAALRKAIEDKMASVQGRLKGPFQEANSTYLDKCIQAALAEDYKIDNPSVQSKIGYLALSLATDGWSGKDTTGTQMGNFLGHWRGGGF